MNGSYKDEADGSAFDCALANAVLLLGDEINVKGVAGFVVFEVNSEFD